MYASFKRIVAAAVVIASALAAQNAEGQLFGSRRVVPAQQPPTQVVPGQPVARQVNGQPAAQANPTQPAGAPANNAVAGEAGAQAGADARFLHGRNLIGMNIWNSNRQNLGTIRDFIVDYQGGDCPTIYFAVAPQIAGWNGDYLIVPFNAFQVGFDAQRRTNYFTMNMSPEEFGKAPRLAVNSWTTGQDMRPFTSARQYYQRVEHSAARPETGGREDRPALPNDPRSGDRTHPQQPNPREPQPQQRLQQQPQEQPPAAGQRSEKQADKPKTESVDKPKNGHETDSDRQPK